MRECRKNAVEKQEFGLGQKNSPGRETETIVEQRKLTLDLWLLEFLARVIAMLVECQTSWEVKIFEGKKIGGLGGYQR